VEGDPHERLGRQRDDTQAPPRHLNPRAVPLRITEAEAHEMQFAGCVINSFHRDLADYPTEVHTIAGAEEILRRRAQPRVCSPWCHKVENRAPDKRDARRDPWIPAPTGKRGLTLVRSERPESVQDARPNG